VFMAFRSGRQFPPAVRRERERDKREREAREREARERERQQAPFALRATRAHTLGYIGECGCRGYRSMIPGGASPSGPHRRTLQGFLAHKKNTTL